MKYYIIAGEASGDLHASNMMKGLYLKDPDACVRFRGGPLMQSVYSAHPCQGGGMAADYRKGAVMGFFELIGKIGGLLNDIKLCCKDIERFAPDEVILVDYPGFNLRVARWAHKQGLKVCYYIAPKVWASREGRIEQLRRYVDRLLIVFPFEKEYFDSKGLPYVYCGNPLVDAVQASPAMQTPREEIRASLGVDPSRRMVALLAGSRAGEVNTMMPLFKEVVRSINASSQEQIQFVVAGAPGREMKDYALDGTEGISVVFGKTQEIVRAADAAVINSGTASLEAVLLDTPQVVAYRIASKITYFVAKNFLLKSKFISLGNLCLDRLAFRELYHYEDCTPTEVATEVKRLLDDKKYRAAMLDDYALIRESLGAAGASERVAAEIVALARQA